MVFLAEGGIGALGLNAPSLIAQLINFAILFLVLGWAFKRFLFPLLDERRHRIQEGVEASNERRGRPSERGRGRGGGAGGGGGGGGSGRARPPPAPPAVTPRRRSRSPARPARSNAGQMVCPWPRRSFRTRRWWPRCRRRASPQPTKWLSPSGRWRAGAPWDSTSPACSATLA